MILYATSISIRITIATVIATVVALPLELRIFAPEIADQIDKTQKELEGESWARENSEVAKNLDERQMIISNNIDRIQTEVRSIAQEINALSKEASELGNNILTEDRLRSQQKSKLFEIKEAARCETTGRDSRGKICVVGPGPIYDQLLVSAGDKETEIFDTEARISDLKQKEAATRETIDSLKHRRGSLESQLSGLEVQQDRVMLEQENLLDSRPQNTAQEAASQDETYSLLTSYKALADLMEEDQSVDWMVTSLWLIFLLVEVSPILAKAMQGDSHYNEIIRNYRRAQGFSR